MPGDQQRKLNEPRARLLIRTTLSSDSSTTFVGGFVRDARAELDFTVHRDMCSK
jgi:hypothetical protein